MTTPRWLFKHDELPSPPPLFRYDKGDTRYYARVTAEGNVIWYPSVTTVIRATSPTPPGLLAWYAKHGMDGATELRDEAARRGTEMHVLFADYLMGKAVDLTGLDEFQAKALAAFDQFCKDHEVEPLAIEILLANDADVYAGTVDLICNMTYKGRRIVAIVDFKSGWGDYRDHAVQLEFYRAAFTQTYLKGIDELFIWSPKDWRTKPTYNLKQRTGEVEYNEVFHRCALYRMTNDVAPKAKVKLSGRLPGAFEITQHDPNEVIRTIWSSVVGDDTTPTLF
jgi:hypothetical protein